MHPCNMIRDNISTVVKDYEGNSCVSDDSFMTLIYVLFCLSQFYLGNQVHINHVFVFCVFCGPYWIYFLTFFLLSFFY